MTGPSVLVTGAGGYLGSQLIAALAALVVVFRRWKREAGDGADPTDADRALVEAALAADREDEGR